MTLEEKYFTKKYIPLPTLMRKFPLTRKPPCNEEEGEAATKATNFDQVAKGCWWMPWHQQAKKDAQTCDNLRGAGKKQ